MQAFKYAMLGVSGITDKKFGNYLFYYKFYIFCGAASLNLIQFYDCYLVKN